MESAQNPGYFARQGYLPTPGLRVASDRPTGGAHDWLKSAAGRAAGNELCTRKEYLSDRDAGFKQPLERCKLLDFGAITLESLDVAAIAHDLLGSEELARNGRSARTLAKGKGMTAVLTAVRAGGEIHEHVAPGPVVIVPVTGAVTVEGLKNRQSLTLGSGRTLFIGQGDKAKSTGFRLRKMPRSSCLSDSSLEETVERRRGLCSAKSRSGVDCAG